MATKQVPIPDQELFAALADEAKQQDRSITKMLALILRERYQKTSE